MPLYSKSIQEKFYVDDGIRICIMRKPGTHTSWDIWMPTLAPSLELLESYQNEIIDWAEYEKRFNNEVIQVSQEHIKLLADMAKNFTITILCWEKTPEQCHRRLIAQDVLRMDVRLKVVIK